METLGLLATSLAKALGRDQEFGGEHEDGEVLLQNSPAPQSLEVSKPGSVSFTTKTGKEGGSTQGFE